MSSNPKMVLLFSGKRKSGKDYLTDLLLSELDNANAVIIRISGPIKSHWAESKNLDLEALLSSGACKEQYRKDMIEWSDEIRNQDYGVFCRNAIQMYEANFKPIWIVSDVRRKTDVNWFKENYGQKVKIIRVEAADTVRKARGWIFTEGVDDVASECGLDDFDHWDWIIRNDGEDDASDLLTNIISYVNNVMKQNQ